MQVYQVFNALAIPPGTSHQLADWPMYARATPQFFGQPWYSNVTIQGEGETTLYGQLQFLCKIQFLTIDNQMVERKIELVKMYIVFEPFDVSQMVECVELTWKTSLEYKCFDISKILKAIHIIPNFMDGTHFFINKYKFR
jgi:hypothetical protein